MGTSVAGFEVMNGQSIDREAVEGEQIPVRREMINMGNSNGNGTNGNSTPPVRSLLLTNEHLKSVRIPDMFGSIMSAEAQVNPNNFKVKAAADAFIAEYVCAAAARYSGQD